MSARFEVVRSDAGWFARFVAANGRKVWQTEVYGRQRDARAAVELIVGDTISTSPYADHPEVYVGKNEWPFEVRTVDERGAES